MNSSYDAYRKEEEFSSYITSVRNLEKHIQAVSQLFGWDGWETQLFSIRPVLQLQSFIQPCSIGICEALSISVR